MIYQIIFLSKKFNHIELNREKGGHMDELVYLRNDEAVCSSLQVAEKFEKRHDNVMRSIEGLLKNEETHEMFKNSSYIEEQNNQRYPMYLMNRDGFSLLVMGFTGKKALDWKLQYIKAFNQMEKFIFRHSRIQKPLQQFGSVPSGSFLTIICIAAARRYGSLS